MEMIDILKASVQEGASDLHFVIGQPPMIRVDGELRPIKEFPSLTAQESRRIIYTLLSISSGRVLSRTGNWTSPFPWTMSRGSGPTSF